MSGGRFEYLQRRYEWQDAIDTIEQVIDKNAHEFPKEIIDEFKQGLIHIKKAKVYLERIDYLLSDDDGEESFINRLKHDLKKLKNDT